MKYCNEDHIYNTASEAYLGTLEDVYNNPEYVCAPRGLQIREKLNYQFVVLNPTADPIVTADLERNVIIANYTAKEFALYNSGTNRVEDFTKASKFWEKIANPDGSINSAYGHLIWYKKSCGNGTLTPWEYCIQTLKMDKDTRQAVLRFSLPEHLWLGNKDQVCTLHAIFFIREDTLHMTVNMRSNDLVKGLVFDEPWFISLMYKLKDELSGAYPTLKIGKFTHYVHSMHLYEKDLNMIEKMLGLVTKENLNG